MGIYATKFKTEGHSSLPSPCLPKNPDWITSHAVVTKLAIVEVERLWKRFELMGCNEKGELTENILNTGGHLGQNVFAKNILQVLMSDDGTVKFLTLLNAMNWAETTTFDQKIVAIFLLLNGGKPVTRDVFFKLITRLYPKETQQSHERLTNILMNQLDARDKGSVTQDQFLKRVRAIPEDTIRAMFNFLIVPGEINEEAHRTFTSQSKYTGRFSSIPEDADFSKQIPSDAILSQIAKKVHTKDWHMLANRLRYTAADIRDFERKNESNMVDQVSEMLKAWRQREGTLATAGNLETALHDCQMNDAAMLLYP